MIITIDGPAGSGKSTVAKLLAKQLEFLHFNSGSLFRAITAYLYEQKFDINSIKVNSILPKFELNVELVNQNQHTFVNGKDYTPVLRDNLISTLVPIVSINENVQNIAQSCIRKFCATHNVVIEGRGVGSSTLPNAEIKIYLDCSIKERAKRRFEEEKSKNNQITLQEIEKQIEERDNLDKNRKIAPLVVPNNAIVVDSSNLGIQETVDVIVNSISKKLI